MCRCRFALLLCECSLVPKFPFVLHLTDAHAVMGMWYMNIFVCVCFNIFFLNVHSVRKQKYKILVSSDMSLFRSNLMQKL